VIGVQDDGGRDDRPGQASAPHLIDARDVDESDPPQSVLERP
jgi:hypothetical protein